MIKLPLSKCPINNAYFQFPATPDALQESLSPVFCGTPVRVSVLIYVPPFSGTLLRAEGSVEIPVYEVSP
jgi:hypothetical protein